MTREGNITEFLLFRAGLVKLEVFIVQLSFSLAAAVPSKCGIICNNLMNDEKEEEKEVE